MYTYPKQNPADGSLIGNVNYVLQWGCGSNKDNLEASKAASDNLMFKSTYFHFSEGFLPVAQPEGTYN